MSSPRHALPADRDAAIETLAGAFATDPFWAYMLDPEAVRVPHALMLEAMAIEYDHHVVHGHSHVIDDHAAALWTPPGIEADMDQISTFFGQHADAGRIGVAMERFPEVNAWKPAEPHFYLHLVGVRDAAQGRGLGSVLLRRVLEICDREAVPAYLEASTPRSAVLYRRHGFERLAEIEFADGVSLIAMLRRPMAGQHQR